MALCDMKTLLSSVRKKKKAIGSFSVGNMEMVIGAIKASEDTNTPIILQIAEVRLTHSPLYLMAPMMVEAAKKAKIDVAVHFDHGLSYGAIEQSLKYGFTSVMYDGSHQSLSDNIEQTKKIISLAKKYDASVEAEIGIIGGGEDGSKVEAIYTDPNDAIEFFKSTGVDALAVSIGNAHGFYKAEPKLNFDVLKQISDHVNTPLVLHGGTGIPDEDFRKAINLGICKINIATATFNAVAKSAENYCNHTSSHNYFSLNEAVIEGVYENVKKHINVFNNENNLL